MNNTFSVYHQVYNNKSKTISSLLSFRKIYPNIHIRLLCDGGVNHDDIADKFNCEYIHDSINIGVYDSLNPKVINGEHIYGWTKSESYIFLKRIYDYCKFIDSKYILFSEDDIVFNKSLTIYNEEFDLTGTKSNNLFPTAFIEYLKQNYPKCNLSEWGCCAGNFINRESFIHCFENSIDFLLKNYELITNNYFNMLGWPDVLFNFIFGIHGMNYIINYEYSEHDISSPIYHDKLTPRVRNN